MGKLLSLLSRDDSNCCAAKSYDVFLDFENAAPTETEREVYDEVERVLKESEVVLDEIQIYKVSRLTRECVISSALDWGLFPRTEISTTGWGSSTKFQSQSKSLFRLELIDALLPYLLWVAPSRTV